MDQKREDNGRWTEDQSGKTNIPTAQKNPSSISSIAKGSIVVFNTPVKMVYLAPNGDAMIQLYKNGAIDGEPRGLNNIERAKYAIQLNMAKKTTLGLDDTEVSSGEVAIAWSKYKDRVLVPNIRIDRLLELKTNREGILGIIARGELEIDRISRDVYVGKLNELKEKIQEIQNKMNGHTYNPFSIPEDMIELAKALKLHSLFEANLDSFIEQSKANGSAQFAPVRDCLEKLDALIVKLEKEVTEQLVQ